jgi:hypothetical protein
LAETEQDKQAIAVAERFADGLLSKQEFAEALHTSEQAVDRLWWLASSKPQAPPGGTFRVVLGTYTGVAASEAERRLQCDVIRDLFGNPFHPLALDHSCLIWNGGTVPKLAQGIYEDRAFDRLPILADALEEAGCTNADILDHCRGLGPHVRGCWVVDLLLGKE